MATTRISDLVNPIVMADSISASITNKIVVSPFARIDDTLTGVPGDTIYVPQYTYIGDATSVDEGEAVDTTTLVATTTLARIKKAMKAVELSDEAVLSGYGNPIGETNNQLAMAIASKVDSDAMDALCRGILEYDGTDEIINYDGIIDAIDIFQEEVNSDKVMFVHPKQMTQLRHDPNFISADKYPGNVVMTGEIGMIANTRIVPSKRVKAVEEDLDNEIGAHYINPIVKIEKAGEYEDETPALTIYIKRDTNVEVERQTLKRVTDISVDKLYTVALSNASKVVLARFKQK